MKKACVVGWPITHSRSPLIHGHWLKKHGIDGSYERKAIEPQDFPAFVENLPASGLQGFNVTAPHKEMAASLITHSDDRVRRTGSANTVYLREGQVHATSTDGAGFCNNVLAAIPGSSFSGKTVLMLGAGGSARAISDELLRRGVRHIHVANRTVSKAEDLRTIFGPQVIPVTPEEVIPLLSTCDLLVNTTTLGLNDKENPDIDVAKLKDAAIVADIVYVPLKTRLLREAEARGLRIVPGLGMLLHQAVEGFSLWFGVRPEVTQELYDLVARDIDPDYRP